MRVCNDKKHAKKAIPKGIAFSFLFYCPIALII